MDLDVRDAVEKLLVSTGKRGDESCTLSSAEEEDIRTQELLGVMRLKSLNRQMSVALDEKRKHVEKRKERVDMLHLKLENLLYKQSYLLQEIKACKDVSTPHLHAMEQELGTGPLCALEFSDQLEEQHAGTIQTLKQEMEARKGEKKAVGEKASAYKKVRMCVCVIFLSLTSTKHINLHMCIQTHTY